MKKKSVVAFSIYNQSWLDYSFNKATVAQILKDLAVASGVDPESVSAHKLRHTFASKLLENGSDIKTLQSMLGHTSLSSTQVYAKLQKSSDETFLESHPLTEEEK